jgi:hypothetical protein
MWDGMSIRSMSVAAGLILGALALYVPRPRPVAPVPIAVPVSQPAQPALAATHLVPLEGVRVSIARQSVPKVIVTQQTLATQRAHALRKLSPDQLCLDSGTSRECEAEFAAVFQRAALSGQALPGTALLAPLRFQKRAAWVRRLETIGKEGIPFMRVSRGPESELVVGIDRKGVLGFSFQQTGDRER